MRKKYFVLMMGKRFCHVVTTNSLGFAKWLMNLRFWTYAKIHNNQTHECLFINDRRAN